MSCERIHAIAHLDARPEKAEELGELLTSLLEPTRQEAGCIRIELQQNRDSPTEFAVVSEWLDEQAEQVHAGAFYTQHALHKLPELLATPMDLRFYRHVA
jgi:quinol monooxygenase YgiN